MSRLFLFVGLLLVFVGCSAGTSQCSPSTCTNGCCDQSGQCEVGTSPQACGTGGLACLSCDVGASCILNLCSTNVVGTGGSSGGGVGATGGGGGSNTGGGNTGGGATGGGAAGGGGGTSGGACAGTLTSCSGVCVDLDAAVDHCGSCSRACGSGQVCNRGTCTLLPVDCTVSGASCAPGFACDPTTHACVSGCARSLDCPMGASCTQSQCACPSSQHACGQICVQNGSVTSCGTSCTACPAAPANATSSCDGVRCDFVCNAGFHRCGTQCVSDSAVATCGSSCTACPTSPNGTATCDGTSCGLSCTSGLHACGSSCVSNASTSTCGTACSPCTAPTHGTSTCDGAACGFACSAGYHACGQSCASNTTTASCGSSCTPCTVPSNGAATCDGTSCGVVCNAGYHRCATGCCTWTLEPVRSDPCNSLDLDVTDGGAVRLATGCARDAGVNFDERAPAGTWSHATIAALPASYYAPQVSLTKGTTSPHVAWFWYSANTSEVRYADFTSVWLSRAVVNDTGGVSATGTGPASATLAYCPSFGLNGGKLVLRAMTATGSTPTNGPLCTNMVGTVDLAFGANELRGVVGGTSVTEFVMTPTGPLTSAVDPASGIYCSMGIDLQGRSHLFYMQANRPRYAVRQGTTWTLESIETGPAVYSSDLAVDRAGNPHVCYLSAVPGFVRYGHKLNGAWVVENVASVTSVSSTSFAGCAIALGPNDEVYVAVGQESGVKLAR